jgi:hypothetical protein
MSASGHLRLFGFVRVRGIADMNSGGKVAMGPGRVKITHQARTLVWAGISRPQSFSFGGIDLLVITVAARGFLETLIWSHRPWPHARIASSNPATPTIAITRFML